MAGNLTTGVGVTPEQVQAARAQMVAKGYNVDPSGQWTSRLGSAWDSYAHTMGAGGSAWNHSGSSGYVAPVDPKTPVGDPRMGTSGAKLSIEQKRYALVKAGYNVTPNGDPNKRVNSAWANYSLHQSNKGADFWNSMYGGTGAANNPNSHPPENFNTRMAATKPAATTKTAKTAFNPNAGLPGQDAGANDPNTTLPNGLTAGQMQSMFQQYAKYLAPSGPDPTAPNINVNQFANAQANMEFDPGIAALTTALSATQTNAQGGQDAITAAYQPAQDLASANVTAGDDAAAKNLALQQSLGASIASALGLSGAAAGQIVKSNANDVSAASTQGLTNHQANLAAGQDVADQASQAHMTAGMSTNSQLASLRSQLIAQQQAKGQAVVKGKTDAQAEQNTEMNNYQATMAQRQGGRVAALEGASDLVTKRGAQIATASNTTNAANQAPAAARIKSAQYKLLLQQGKVAAADAYRVLNPTGKAGFTWGQATNYAAKDKILQSVGDSVHNAKDPQDAMNKALARMSNQWNFSDLAAKKAVYQMISDRWLKSNKNWVGVPATLSFKRTGK